MTGFMEGPLGAPHAPNAPDPHGAASAARAPRGLPAFLEAAAALRPPPAPARGSGARALAAALLLLGSAAALGPAPAAAQALPTLSVGDARVDEPVRSSSNPDLSNIGTVPAAEVRASTSLRFPLTLSATPGSDIMVQWRVTRSPLGGSTTTSVTTTNPPAGHDWFYDFDGRRADAQVGASPLTLTRTFKTNDYFMNAYDNGFYLHVVVVEDDDVEGDETFEIQILNVNGGAMLSTDPGADTAVGTVVDNDFHAALTAAPVETPEGNSGPTLLEFVVTLDQAPGTQVEVEWRVATTTSTATLGTDFTSPAGGTLTFGPTETEKRIQVQVTGDTDGEPDETVVIEFLNPSAGLGINTSSVTGTIRNDDIPVFSINDTEVFEGPDGSSSTLRFTVELSGDSAVETTVDYEVSRGPNTDADDVDLYPGQDPDPATTATGTLSFPPGTNSRTIDVVVNGDNNPESNPEFVEVALSNPGGGAGLGTKTTGTGRIRDDDHRVVFSGASVTEGDANSTTTMTFTATLQPMSVGTVLIDYMDQTSTFGTPPAQPEDYELVPGTLMIPAGETVGRVEVTVIGDDMLEENEQVVVGFSNARVTGSASGSSVQLPATDATGTIRNDDDPSLSISSQGVDEGADGAMPTLTFTVALEAPPSGEVMVDYTVGDGTATLADNDYEATAGGTLMFAAGTTNLSQTVDVVVNGDDVPEADETVRLTLSNLRGDAQFRRKTDTTLVGEGVIRTDEVVVTIDSPEEAEVSGGTLPNLDFTVRLSSTSSEAVTVDYTVGGEATPGVDYTAALPATLPAGSLTIPAGLESGRIRLRIERDLTPEGPETVVVTLSNPMGGGAVILPGMETGTGTIYDNISVMTVDPPDPSVSEGPSGRDASLTFRLTLDRATSGDVVFMYETVAASSTAASGVDFRPIATSTGFIRVGTAATTVTVMVIGDDVGEGDETVAVRIINSQIGTDMEALFLDDGRSKVVLGTIRDDDASGQPQPQPDLPELSVSAPAMPADEPSGSAGATSTLTFTVSLSEPAPAGGLTVTYEVTGGTPGEDYEGSDRRRTVVILAGQTSADIVVVVRNDGRDDLRDPLGVRLVRATGATIPADMRQAETEVRNDTPLLTVGNPSADEGASSTPGTLEFVVRLDRPAPSGGVPISYTVLDTGTATATDYVAPIIPLVIQSGSTTAVLRIVLVGNDEVESDKTVVVRFSVQTGYAFAGGGTMREATGTIRNDDGDPGARTRALTHVLSGVGRTIAGTVVDLIWDRAGSHRSGASGSHATVGGRPLDAGFGGGQGGAALRAAGAIAGLLGVDAGSPGSLLREAERRLASGGGLGALRDWADLPDGRALVGRSRFAVSFAGHDGGPGALTVWGRGSLASFESGLEDGFSAEGDVMAGHLGFDYRFREGFLAGAALGHTGGNIDYALGEKSDGEIETEITSLHPYLHWISPGGLGVWATVGYGTGTAEVDDRKDAGKPFETDLTMQMLGGGVRDELASAGSFDIAVKADAFLVETAADEVADGNVPRLNEVDAASSRARLALEGATRKALEGGGVFAGRFELGARYDGGDAEEGAGADIAAGFDYGVPGLGLEVTGRGSLLLAHQEDDFQEWGLDLGVVWDPGAAGRGVQFSVEPGWGAPVRNAASAWGSGAGLGAREASPRGTSLDARLGYGLGILDGRGLATVFGELGGSGRDGRLRLGAELRPAGAGSSGLGLEFYGERRDRPAGPDHSVVVKGRFGF